MLASACAVQKCEKMIASASSRVGRQKQNQLHGERTWNAPLPTDEWKQQAQAELGKRQLRQSQKRKAGSKTMDPKSCHLRTSA